MRQKFITFCTVFIGCFLGYAQEKTNDKSSFFDDVIWNIDNIPFARFTGFADALGTINSDNRIATLNEFDTGLFIRPDLKYKKSNLTLWASPRLNSIYEDLTKEIDVEFYFQSLKAKIQVSEAFYIAGGRYLKQFGTSIFINPSNPFFLDPGRLNPKIEIRPMDFVELNIATKKNLDLTLIANLSKGETQIVFDDLFFEFSNRYGLLVDYYGDSYNIGSIFSMTEDERYHLGIYGQKNLNDAVVIWLDSALEYNMNRFYPVEGHETELIPFEMVNGEENKELFFSGLLGASYTFNFGPTLNLEYYYNGKGYDDEDAQRYYNMIASSANFNFDVTRDLSDLNLGRAINTGMPYTRKNYVFSQFGENDVFGELSYNLRYFYSIDDQSSQLSSLIEWNALDNLEVFTVFLSNFGSRQSDFKRLLDYQLMVGLIYRL